MSSSSDTRPLGPEPAFDVEPAPAPSVAVMERPINILELRPQAQVQVRQMAAALDVTDSHSVIAFGAAAQSDLSASADQMLDRVRNKDVGPVGDVLSDLMLHVRGLGVDDLKPGQKPSWLQRNVLRHAHPIARFVQRYETVQGQVDAAVRALDGHKVQLLRDVTMLDKLFVATLDYFHQLELYIAAAELKLTELDETVIPALEAKARATGELLDGQTLRDMQARRDDLERRLHDLRLTRMVTMQSLPQIRLIQDVDKSLITKIQSSILTTIPVWKSQIALAITLWNQQKALETQKKVTDTTNEMLARNAELLRAGSAEARKEIERGIFDVATVQKVNDELIATIQESLDITAEGKRKRAEAEAQLQTMERDLKQALIEARGREQG